MHNRNYDATTESDIGELTDDITSSHDRKHSDSAVMSTDMVDLWNHFCQCLIDLPVYCKRMWVWCIDHCTEWFSKLYSKLLEKIIDDMNTIKRCNILVIWKQVRDLHPDVRLWVLYKSEFIQTPFADRQRPAPDSLVNLIAIVTQRAKLTPDACKLIHYRAIQLPLHIAEVQTNKWDKLWHGLQLLTKRDSLITDNKLSAFRDTVQPWHISTMISVLTNAGHDSCDTRTVDVDSLLRRIKRAGIQLHA